MLELLLTAVALAMDATAVSVGIGIAVKRLSAWTILKPALFFGGFQALMPAIGFLLGRSVREYILAFDHIVAFALMAGIGAKMIWDALHETECDPERGEAMLRTGALAVLGVATSIDALAVGIGLAMTQTGLWEATLVIGCVTIALCALGVALGKRLGRLFQKRAGVAGGVVLILLGAKIWIEHAIGGI